MTINVYTSHGDTFFFGNDIGNIAYNTDIVISYNT